MDQSPKPKLRPKLRLSYDDLKKIERVVNEEAKGEGVEGRNAIRGVIFNRLMSERFPNSVDEVLSPKEFEPVGKYGSIDKIPVDENTLNERLTEMADYIQYGEDASKGSTFFLNKKLAKKRKTDFGGKGGMTIGNHTFYKSYEGQEPVEDVNFSHNVEVYYEGYDAGGFVSKFMDMITSPLTGDYRKEKPISVEAADTAVSLTTPIDSIVDIQAELEKEDPDYLKIGMLGGMEAIGLLGAGAPKAAQAMIRKGADMARQTDEVVEVASSVPKVSRSVTPSYTDEALLEADDILTEWGKGNLTNPQLRKAMIDKGFKIETKTITPKMTADDIEVVGPDGNITRWKDMPRGTNKQPQMSNEDYDMRMAALDEIEDIKEWQQAAKKEIETGRVVDPQIKTPELEESTRLLLDNKITREEHLANVDKYKPVNSWDALPREPSNKAVVFSLDDGQRRDGFFVLDNAAEMSVNKSSLKIGDIFNGRLDIPAYNRYDTWIVTGTSKNAEKGKHYAKAIHYRSGDGEPVKFISSTKTSEKIGKGEINKTPYATVQGYIEDLDADAIRDKAAEYLNDPEWTQVGFDPRRQGGFYVRAGENKHVPVREATEVIQIGPLILAKNAKLDMEYSGYNEGGMAMDEQMGMMFKSSRGMAMNEGGEIGEAPDTTVGVDPVSGNEIPLGSTAENVRDDIPAQLSEGEYVVPADVVRYYGVKFFEDLRTEAKLGFQKMQENGRIGGEPVGMEMAGDELPFDISELQMTDDGEEQPMMAAGGYMKSYAPGGFESYSPTDYQPGGSMGTDGLEVIKYEHPDGRVLFIQFMNGTPLTMIPEGFEKADTASEEVSEAVSEQVTRTDSDDDNNAPPIEAPEPIEWSTEATVEDFQNYAKKRGGFGQKAIAVGAGMVAGLPGTALVRMAQKMEDSRVREGLKAQIEAANEAGNTTKASTLQAILDGMTKESGEEKERKGIVEKSGIFGGKSSIYEDLEDTDGTKGASFGDTWLGDLLGFDEDGFGVQGDSLADSLAGSRRDGETPVPSATSSGDDSSNLWDNVVKSGNNDNSSIGKDAGDGMTWVKDPTGNSNAVVRVRSDSTAAKGQKAAMEGWDE